MSKYRIIKVPMYYLVGKDSFLGYEYAYQIQKKILFWWKVVGQVNINLDDAKADLEKIKVCNGCNGNHYGSV